MLGLCQAPEETVWRDDIMLEHHGHYGETHFQRQLRHGDYKYVAHLDDLGELYNISADPFETNNLINEPTMQPILGNLQERLRLWMARHEDNSAEAQRLLRQITD